MKKGDKFGRLTAIKFIERKIIIKNGRSIYSYLWLFKCSCGNEIIRNKFNITHGNTRSCGCLHNETLKQNWKNCTTHGLYKGLKKNSKEYVRTEVIYKSIIQRCKDKKHKLYKYYGGSGISCTWKSYKEFCNDMIKSYNKHVDQYGINDTFLSRIDRDKNYDKENCKWVTAKEKYRAHSNTVLIDGLSQAEFARKNNMRYKTFVSRRCAGWKIEDILTGIHRPDVGQKSYRETNLVEIKNYLMEEFKKDNNHISELFNISLDIQEKEILNNRLGFINVKRKTLQEIGEQLKLTRERIRQIEFRALKKLSTVLTIDKVNKIT